MRAPSIASLVRADTAVNEGHLAAGEGADIALMGDHHDGPALDVQFGEQFQDRVAGRGVKVAGRLVREQNRRVVGQRAGDRRALLLASREGGRQLVGLIADTHPL